MKYLILILTLLSTSLFSETTLKTKDYHGIVLKVENKAKSNAMYLEIHSLKDKNKTIVFTVAKVDKVKKYDEDYIKRDYEVYQIVKQLSPGDKVIATRELDNCDCIHMSKIKLIEKALTKNWKEDPR